MTPLHYFRIFCSVLLLTLFLHHFPVLAAPDVQKDAQKDAAQPEAQRIAPDALFALTLVNAEKGQSRAMLQLGILYEDGIGVGRNYTKALEWYQKAAYAREGEGYLRVGTCYEIGIGAAVDLTKAAAAFEKAVALNHAPALLRLAGVYLNGRGVDKDENKGFTLLNKAAEAGDSVAMFDLGLIALNGLYGRKAEDQKARNWFLKAAEAGHAGGILSIAGMCWDGKGGRKDEESALRWYLTAWKVGLQAEGLEIENAIEQVKKTLSAKQIEAVEKAVDAWMAARVEAAK